MQDNRCGVEDKPEGHEDDDHVRHHLGAPRQNVKDERHTHEGQRDPEETEGKPSQVVESVSLRNKLVRDVDVRVEVVYRRDGVGRGQVARAGVCTIGVLQTGAPESPTGLGSRIRNARGVALYPVEPVHGIVVRSTRYNHKNQQQGVTCQK